AANTAVRNLDAAQTQVRSFLVNPTASEFLSAGAAALRDYVGNTTVVIGQVYREVAQVAVDRTTAPAVAFTRLTLALQGVPQWYRNLSQSLDVIHESFNYDDNFNTATYLDRLRGSFYKNVEDLSEMLGRLDGAISSVTGENLNTQQFLQVVSANGTLQQLVDVVESTARLSTDYSTSVTKLVAAVRTANDFQTRSYTLLRTNQASINTNVDRYTAASSASFYRFLTAADSLLTHLKSTNESFVFRWPLLFSDSVRQKLNMLNQSIDNLTGNLGQRTAAVTQNLANASALFKEGNSPLGYLRGETELYTRVMLDVLDGDNYCATGFVTSFHALPPQVTSLVAACLTEQTNLENQGAAQLISLANNFLRPYVTAVYGRLNICFQQPFHRMTECLDNIVATVDFSDKFFLLDLASQLYFQQVQEELSFCNDRVMQFVQNAGLCESCQMNSNAELRCSNYDCPNLYIHCGKLGPQSR
uniref:Uncharacterized protein n=1 Tax=Anopheles epiroticus TaxID=199890 RepID=A0A182P377_9DIPT